MVLSNKTLRFIIAIVITCLPLFSFSNTNDSVQPKHETHEVAATESKKVDEKAEIKEQIEEVKNHHVLDGHEFSLFSDKETGAHYGFPLPIILWDNGLQVFSSSEFFHHGKTKTFIDEKGHEQEYKIAKDKYAIFHEKIYIVNENGELAFEHAHPTNKAPLDFSITKSVVTIIIVALLMFLLFSSLAKSFPKNGGIASGAGRFFEPIVLYVRDEIAIPNIGEKHYKKYMSHLLTVFFFIWFLNMFGLTPLGINVTGNIAITFGLAIITFLITNLSANKNYWGHIFWMPGVPVPMKIILAPIELMGLIIKPFALMIRLYANMFAGHIVLMSLIGLMFIFKNWLGSSLSFALSFMISIIEILVALLQAYIFTILTALYFGSAVQEHHHDEEEAHH